MYNPLDASATELAADDSLISDDFEFIEVQNISADTTIDLSGARFTEGVRFDFTNAPVTAACSWRTSGRGSQFGRLHATVRECSASCR